MMNSRTFLVMMLIGIAAMGHAAEPAEVAFYECLKCDAPPVMDGRLDDACWTSLPVMDQFYKYWTPVPTPPPLRTEARMCYGDQGLYLGITMFEQQLDKIKAQVTSRDDPETWMDDCVEIMIDPHNTGHSYYKFTTNFNGTRHDQKATRLVLDDGWNVEGWQVKTSRGERAWFIEFFLPWTDLDLSPKEGDIWSFTFVRYGWATGGFLGSAWSLGGAGAAPGKFGYIGFGPAGEDRLKRLEAAIIPTKGESFRIMSAGEVLTHGPTGRWTRERLAEWLRGARTDADRELGEAEAAVGALPVGPEAERLARAAGEVKARIEEMTSEPTPVITALFAYHAYRQLARKAAEAKWDAMVLQLVADAAK